MYTRDLFIERAQLALLDAAVAFASFIAAAWVRHGVRLFAPDQSAALRIEAYLFPATLLAAGFVLLFRYQGLYSIRFGRFAEAIRVVRGATIGLMGFLALTFFDRSYSYSRATILIFYPLSIGLLLLARNLYRGYQRAVRAHPAARRRALILGFGEVGHHLGRELLERPSYYELRGFLDDDPLHAGAALQGKRVLGTTADLSRVVQDERIDEAIIAMPSAPRQRIMELVGACLHLKVRFKVVPDLYDLMLERVHFDQVGGLPLVGLRGGGIVGFNWALKRAFDLGVAAILLLLTAPLFLLIAIAVKATSSGPVLYRQARVGLHGKRFTFLKFRSMRAGTDASLHRAFTADWIYGKTGGDAKPTPRSLGAAAKDGFGDAGGVHKITSDPRVTWVGRMLRRSSLDELPQLLNVLRGEMSLVGPRPAIAYEVERYTEWHKRRLDVLPGITGLWQVSGRNALSFEEMVRLDIDYIESWSFELDLKILVKTVPAVLFGKAY